MEENKKENKMKKEKKGSGKGVKRQISIITVFLWIFLVITMITITTSSIRKNNAIEEESINITNEICLVLKCEESIEDLSRFEEIPYIEYWNESGKNIIELSESGKTEEGDFYLKFIYSGEMPITYNNQVFLRLKADIPEYSLCGESFGKYFNTELTVLDDEGNDKKNLFYNSIESRMYNELWLSLSLNDYRNINSKNFYISTYIECEVISLYDTMLLRNLLFNLSCDIICRDDDSHNFSFDYMDISFDEIIDVLYLLMDNVEIIDVCKKEDEYFCNVNIKSEEFLEKTVELINPYISEKKHLYYGIKNNTIKCKLFDSDKGWVSEDKVVIYVNEEGKEKEQITVNWLNGYTDTPIMTELIDKDYSEENIFALYPNNPKREGYEFLNWSEWKFDEKGNIEIIAQWKKLPQYIVKYEWKGLPEDNNISIPVGNNYYKDEIVKIDTNYKKGSIVKVNDVEYEFSGWSSEDVELSSNLEITMPEKDVVLSGIWKEKEVKIEEKDVFEDYNLPNTSDINIFIYVVIFFIAIIGVIVGIIFLRRNKKISK